MKNGPNNNQIKVLWGALGIGKGQIKTTEEINSARVKKLHMGFVYSYLPWIDLWPHVKN